MREIVHIQIGKAGNAAGLKFWEAVCEEHGINPSGTYIGQNDNQLEKINVYFHENLREKFIPRAVAFDLDPASVEDVFWSKYGRLFKRRNLVCGSRKGTENNWARGFYTEGRKLAGFVLDSIRREAEKCDCLDGFQIVHSLGGGTGSGLGSYVMGVLRQEYPTRCLSAYSIFPSPDIIVDRIQTYNAVMGLQHVTEYSVQTYCMDNFALEHICEKFLEVPKAGFNAMNYLISTAMAAITTTNRLPGHLNEGVIKSSINMIPFPRLQFLTPGFAPICPEGTNVIRTLEELKSDMMDSQNIFIYPPNEGKYLTASYIIRGLVPQMEIDLLMSQMFKKNWNKYVKWLPDNKKYVVCPVPLRGIKLSAAMVGNTTGIKTVFSRILEFFDVIQEEKNYIHWLTGEYRRHPSC
ncbi:UNVERIFIED_CONTAM: hypothetical protein PYX00_009355 [Menopon gallinae]|uniref:Tubulin beta chain n=1 Tax=Menopon gallinae TaxID=328185 RepID=A0AAW2HBI0_9NEOP